MPGTFDTITFVYCCQYWLISSAGELVIKRCCLRCLVWDVVVISCQQNVTTNKKAPVSKKNNPDAMIMSTYHVLKL